MNLLEYKSPTDYVSVSDFYKVYAYACLYASFEKVPVTDLTLTFVESRYPRGLLAHLKKIRGYKVEENSPGIYTIKGDILPIQIINTRKLSAEENLWLKGLSNRLDPLMVLRIGEETERYGNTARVNAYITVVIKANFHAIEEARNMSSTAKSLDDVLIKIGLAAKWEAEGEAKGMAIGEARGEAKGVAIGETNKALDIAQNMINLGLPLETIVSATMLDPETVRTLFSENK